MSTTVYTYVPEKNPDATYLPGVPLRDLTDEDLRALTPHLAASVAECPFYTAGPGSVPQDVQDTIAAWRTATSPAAPEPDATEQKTADQPQSTADTTPAAVVVAKRTQPRPAETKSDSSGE